MFNYLFQTPDKLPDKDVLPDQFKQQIKEIRKCRAPMIVNELAEVRFTQGLTYRFNLCSGCFETNLISTESGRTIAVTNMTI